MLDKTGRGVSYSDSSALASAATEHIRALDAALARTENAERAFTKAASVYDGLCQSAGNLELLRQKAAAYDQSLPLREAEKIERELDFYRRAIDGLLVQEREFEKKAAVLTGTMQKPDELAAHISALSPKSKRSKNSTPPCRLPFPPSKARMKKCVATFRRCLPRMRLHYSKK